jgi:hypothetical protein
MSPVRQHIFRMVSIEMPGPLVPAGKPATSATQAPQFVARRGTHAWSMYVHTTSDAPGGNRKATEMPVQYYEVSTILYSIQFACWLHGV